MLRKVNFEIPGNIPGFYQNFLQCRLVTALTPLPLRYFAMIKFLSRLMGSAQSEELTTDALVQEIEDTEASKVSGGWGIRWW